MMRGGMLLASGRNWIQGASMVNDQGDFTFDISNKLKVKAGDLLFVSVAADDDANTPTSVTGWTLGQSQYGTTSGSAFWYKTAVGGDTFVFNAALSTDWKAATAHAVVLRKGYTYNSSDESSGASGQPDAPSLLSFVAGDISLIFGHAASLSVLTKPSGYTSLGTRAHTYTGLETSSDAAYKVSASGTENPAAWTGTISGDWTAYHIRVNKP